jgi:two-component system KDP operon response regulator KdpE
VDDDPGVRRLLRDCLTGCDFGVETVARGQKVVDLVGTEHPDLVLLDPGAPDLDGLEAIRRLRDEGEAPVVVLSARDDEAAKVAALEAGADDYITKPFGLRELVARVRVRLRLRPGSAQHGIFRTEDLEVDFQRHRVLLAGREVRLGPKEFRLLRVLIEVGGRTLTERELLRRVWGPGYGSEKHSLQELVGRLRRKLAGGGANARYIITVPRVGYRFATPDQGGSAAERHSR